VNHLDAPRVLKSKLSYCRAPAGNFPGFTFSGGDKTAAE
jgi:hypothetical protein